MSEHNHSHSCPHHGDLSGSCHPVKGRPDYLYYGSLLLVAVSYLFHALGGQAEQKIQHICHQVFNLMNDMWWGIALSVLAVGFLNKIPRELVMNYFSSEHRLKGLAKATLAGTLFDLCNHGVLILGMKIYERGASLGQTMAFLIASPWNSFSLTLIMYTLIGGHLTFLFLIFSLVIAILTGWIFDELVVRGVLPKNPHAFVPVRPEKVQMQWQWSWRALVEILKDGFSESKMILKWIFVGTLLSALVGAFVTPDMFVEYFGKTPKGLLMTLLAATGLEVCSEGSVPLAADLVRIAQAPGNAFVFLMAGVATDLTEIMAIRETTKSWKIAWLLPLITVPQIVLFGILINLGFF